MKNIQNRTAGEEAFDKGFYEISEYLVEKEVSKLKNIEIIEDDKEEANIFENEESQNNPDEADITENNKYS